MTKYYRRFRGDIPEPRASLPWTTYRYPNPYGGWITIGARTDAEALGEAARSLTHPNVFSDKLERWNDERQEYVSCGR